MLRVPVEVRKSSIHGYGVFALSDIHKGQVVWMFDHLDQRYSACEIEFWEKRLKQYAFERGYVNQRAETVLCIDEAQFLNFPSSDRKANLCLGGLQDGEYLLLAAVDIYAGTELTVPPESDGDYATKIRGP